MFSSALTSDARLGLQAPPSPRRTPPLDPSASVSARSAETPRRWEAVRFFGWQGLDAVSLRFVTFALDVAALSAFFFPLPFCFVIVCTAKRGHWCSCVRGAAPCALLLHAMRYTRAVSCGTAARRPFRKAAKSLPKLVAEVAGWRDGRSGVGLFQKPGGKHSNGAKDRQRPGGRTFAFTRQRRACNGAVRRDAVASMQARPLQPHVRGAASGARQTQCVARGL